MKDIWFLLPCSVDTLVWIAQGAKPDRFDGKMILEHNAYGSLTQFIAASYPID